LKSVFKNNQPATGLNDLNVTEYAGAGANNRVVRYITNHDVNSSDGTPLDLFGGKPGSVAAFAVTALMNCVPMVYNGQEVGTPYRLTFPFTGSTINWTLNPGMVAEYKKIIAFRNSSAAVRRGSMTAYSTADICAFLRTSETDTVFAAVNLRDAAHDFALPASVTGKSWQDALTGEAVSPNSIITLPGYAYLVLKK
jgi:glycosidase